MKKEWVLRRLEDVATLQRGFDLPTQDRVSGSYPLVSSSGIIDSHETPAAPSPGVVTGRSGSIGNVFFIEDEFWPLNTVLYVKDFHGNDPRFIFYLLQHFDLKRFATGVGVPTLNRNFVHDELVSVPSNAEQQRIVSILDEAFEGIATATANAEKNLSNARELFKCYLQAVFVSHKGWLTKRLGDLATFRNGINFTKSSTGDVVEIVGVKDFQNYFYAPVGSLDSVITEGTLPDSDLLRKNDILFVRSNGNMELIGRSLLIGDLERKTTFSGFTIRARLKSDNVLPEYLCHYIKSESARRTMIDGGNGVNIKSLNQTILTSLMIPLPPSINEQKAVVEQLESLSRNVQSLESVYQQKLSALSELKKSILHQAFTGQLH